MPLAELARTWGSTPAERQQPFPCDKHLPHADDAYHRAVDVDAPAAVLFRWLCQLRVAPYSYDWIDNLGRRSPRHLTPGLEQLAVGQRLMTILRLVEFQPDGHLTVVHRGPIFGEVAVTYRVVASAPASSRLAVKVLVRYPRIRVLGALLRRALPLGDLIMMRRQLLTLKRLAERQVG